MDESLKWMVLVAAAVGVYWVARSSRQVSDVDAPAPDVEFGAADAKTSGGGFDVSDAVIPSERDNVVVLDYAFKKIDLRSGPPDPSDFFDDLTVNFYDRSTGHKWKQEFQVGTPAGIGRYMREQHWRSLRMDGGTIIVDKFDIDLLLETILDPGDVDTPESELERQIVAKVNQQNYLE